MHTPVKANFSLIPSAHFFLIILCTPTQEMAFLPLKGRVDLRSPDLELALLLDYGSDPNAVTEQPVRLFFGRKVQDAADLVKAWWHVSLCCLLMAARVLGCGDLQGTDVVA